MSVVALGQSIASCTFNRDPSLKGVWKVPSIMARLTMQSVTTRSFRVNSSSVLTSSALILYSVTPMSFVSTVQPVVDPTNPTMIVTLLGI